MSKLTTEGTVTVEKDGHILLIGLDNPTKYNAFDIKMFHDLSAAYGELEADPELRCGVLYGHGEHFTAGLNLPEWLPEFKAGRFVQVPEGGIDPLGLSEPRLNKPLVIAVHGWCLTIGIELLLAADVRVAATDTRFAQIEIKRGIYPVGGATVRMPRQIGWGNAMRYLLTGDEFSGEEAYRMGLVQEVTEPGQQRERAVEIARRIAAQAPLGVMATLKSARNAREFGDQAALDRLLTDLKPLLESDDAMEGLQSFVEKRPANFKGV
ncbi:MAG: crotonase/enoyl-CoA hydratase family protein [Anaerolineae bacterium]